jgi:hypothetical protein
MTGVISLFLILNSRRLILLIIVNTSDPNNPIKRTKKYESDQKGNWIKKIETMTDYNNKFIVTERKINYR